MLRDWKFQNRIDDSKKITQRQRESAFLEIYEKAYVGIGIVSESVIDTSNIVEATYHAMSVAVSELIAKLPSRQTRQKKFSKEVFLLIDGKFFKTTLPYTYQTIVSGDALSLSIASASIVAKVTRDRILTAYDKVFPQYGFRQHKGYGTLAHRRAIKKYGPSLIHIQSLYRNSTVLPSHHHCRSPHQFLFQERHARPALRQILTKVKMPLHPDHLKAIARRR